MARPPQDAHPVVCPGEAHLRRALIIVKTLRVFATSDQSGVIAMAGMAPRLAEVSDPTGAIPTGARRVVKVALAPQVPIEAIPPVRREKVTMIGVVGAIHAAPNAQIVPTATTVATVRATARCAHLAAVCAMTPGMLRHADAARLMRERVADVADGVLSRAWVVVSGEMRARREHPAARAQIG